MIELVPVVLDTPALVIIPPRVAIPLRKRKAAEGHSFHGCVLGPVVVNLAFDTEELRERRHADVVTRLPVDRPIGNLARLRVHAPLTGLIQHVYVVFNVRWVAWLWRGGRRRIAFVFQPRDSVLFIDFLDRRNVERPRNATEEGLDIFDVVPCFDLIGRKLKSSQQRTVLRQCHVARGELLEVLLRPLEPPAPGPLQHTVAVEHDLEVVDAGRHIRNPLFALAFLPSRHRNGRGYHGTLVLVGRIGGVAILEPEDNRLRYRIGTSPQVDRHVPALTARRITGPLDGQEWGNLGSCCLVASTGRHVERLPIRLRRAAYPPHHRNCHDYRCDHSVLLHLLDLISPYLVRLKQRHGRPTSCI